MSNNAPDYENNLAFDPDINTMPRCDIEALKSEIKKLKDLQNAQDKRVEELEKTEVELEKVKKQLNIAVETITALAIVGKYSIAIEALHQIEELK